MAVGFTITCTYAISAATEVMSSNHTHGEVYSI